VAMREVQHPALTGHLTCADATRHGGRNAPAGSTHTGRVPAQIR